MRSLNMSKSKFIKVFPKYETDYLVWERDDNPDIVIVKDKGSKEYIVVNQKTCQEIRENSLKSAKRIGLLNDDDFKEVCERLSK